MIADVRWNHRGTQVTADVNNRKASHLRYLVKSADHTMNPSQIPPHDPHAAYLQRHIADGLKITDCIRPGVILDFSP